MDVTKRGMSDTNQQALFHQYCIDTFQHSEALFWQANIVREKQRDRFITGDLGDDDELVVFYDNTKTENDSITIQFNCTKDSGSVCTLDFSFQVCHLISNKYTYNVKYINQKTKIQSFNFMDLPRFGELNKTPRLCTFEITDKLYKIKLHPFLCVQSILFAYKNPSKKEKIYDKAKIYIKKIINKNDYLTREKLIILCNILKLSNKQLSINQSEILKKVSEKIKTFVKEAKIKKNQLEDFDKYEFSKGQIIKMEKEIKNEQEIMMKDYEKLESEIQKLEKKREKSKTGDYLSKKDSKAHSDLSKRKIILIIQINKKSDEKMKMKKLETFINNQLKDQIYISRIDDIYRLYMKGIQHDGSIIDNPEQRIIKSCITALDNSIKSVEYDLEHVFEDKSYM